MSAVARWPMRWDRCGVQDADVLHITSWDSDHCSATELPDLLRLVRPTKLELPGYEPFFENAKRCAKILADYVGDVRTDNRPKSLRQITPEYIDGLETAQSLCFKNTFYNPRTISPDCANDNSTVKLFRAGRGIMALIRAFEEKRRDRQSIHDAIDATYSVFERDRRAFVQVRLCPRAS
jgi:hypothetical protein